MMPIQALCVNINTIYTLGWTSVCGIEHFCYQNNKIIFETRMLTCFFLIYSARLGIINDIFNLFEILDTSRLDCSLY